MPASLTKWSPYVPRWLGNSETADPFFVEIKRLTVGERRAFLSGLADLRRREEEHRLAEKEGTPYTIDELCSLLGMAIRGPFAQNRAEPVALRVDSEEFPAGDLGKLVRFAADESVGLRKSLLFELLLSIEGKNVPTGEDLGESAA